MIAILRVLIFATILFGAIGLSRASTSSCASASDGTSCVTSCIAAGVCQARVCTPVTLRPDGTACSSENFCTSSDQCVAGVCVAGPAVVCPDTDECHKGFCAPNAGCAVVNICVPDLTGPGPVEDMGANDLAITKPNDMGASDLAITKLNDMCFYDPSTEFVTCNGEDGPYQVPADAGLPDASVDVPFHVRGSSIGDCAIGGSLARPLYGSILLVLAALYYACRARPFSTARVKSASARDRRAPPRP